MSLKNSGDRKHLQHYVTQYKEDVLSDAYQPYDDGQTIEKARQRFVETNGYESRINETGGIMKFTSRIRERKRLR